ncbi:MAG TPA: RIP metalloprotease RseP [Candidatus Udaeobacter sp.]|jgi:regulator of sigma E protease|nr:RIP metalloprotease RseP [Candidatus Udaeobacter sp.]
MSDVLGWLGAGIPLLGLVIFVHELGHFLAAKARGVRVLRFSLGFGPKMIGFKRGETEYQISWVPLGGYVQMAGDSPGEDGSMPEGPDQFLSHPWPGRMLIAVSGPLANLVTAFVIMVVVGMIGVSYPDAPNVLGAVPDTSVAHARGLREGDHVIGLNGTRVRSWVEIFVLNSRVDHTRPVELKVRRADRVFSVPLSADQREPLFSSLQRPADPPLVGSVITGMPAYKAGLKDGDRIVLVDGDSIATWSDLRAHIGARADRPVHLRLSRGGDSFDVTLTPMNSTGRSGGPGQIGIEPPFHGFYVERHSLLESIDLGFHATLALVANVYRGMWLTVSRPLYYREYLGGPLFIAQAANEAARRGLDSYLQLLAMINIAIMAFNLLPLPVLDGGHILLALLQALRRQGISVRTYLNFQRIGLIVLGTLFILIVVVNDPWRVIQRQRALERAPRPAPREKVVAPTAR